MSVAEIVVIFLLSPLATILIMRVFPDLISASLVKGIEHHFNKKLERTKIELQSAHSTLKTSVDYLSVVHSGLRSDVIDNVRKIWEAVLFTRREFGDLDHLDLMFLPHEVDAAIKGLSRPEIIQHLFGYRDISLISKKMEKIHDLQIEKTRLFVGDRVWLIFFIFRAVYGRRAYLFQESLKVGNYKNWKDDAGMSSLFSAVLSADVIEKAKAQKVGGFESLITNLEAEFLKEGRLAISGSKEFAERLSDIQAVLSFERSKISEASTAS